MFACPLSATLMVFPFWLDFQAAGDALFFSAIPPGVLLAAEPAPLCAGPCVRAQPVRRAQGRSMTGRGPTNFCVLTTRPPPSPSFFYRTRRAGLQARAGTFSHAPILTLAQGNKRGALHVLRACGRGVVVFCATVTVERRTIVFFVPPFNKRPCRRSQSDLWM